MGDNPSIEALYQRYVSHLRNTNKRITYQFNLVCDGIYVGVLKYFMSRIMALHIADYHLLYTFL